jgi:DNA-binding SARP family transcriptional activator
MPAMTPPPRLTLGLLGGFSLERDAQPCKLAYEKGRALLAYLAMDPHREHSRGSMAAMLWPDLAREAALSNLRLVLHSLRQTLNAANLAAPLLQIDRESVRLDPAAGLEIDVAEFSAAAPTCPATPCAQYCDPCLARMEKLAGHYRGEFMAGFSLPDCPDFEEWLQVQRESLHLHALSGLARLSDCHEQTGAYGKSLRFALRYLELEPWSEEGLRRAMRLFALNGQRANALAQYETCCRALRTELGVLPSEETHALAERIRRGDLAPAVNHVPAHLPTADLQPAIAERRQVTVLYCELASVGVEDPDEALALLREPQARCNEIIRGYSGYLVQIRGGSLLVYFGYPQASENAARLAVKAALTVTRETFAGLELRASVHTGVVISGDLHVPDAIGATSGLAIRLRQFADCGEVVISGATQHLVAGYFECMSLGPRPLTGSARPVEAFRVDRESGAKDRLEAAATLTPLIGRRDEIDTLLAAWQDARQGARRIVLLSGDAGIGKSRLVLTLKDALREQACFVRELRCFPEHSQSPFHPLAALFGSTLGFSPDDTTDARFARLTAYVETHYAKTDRDAVPLLAGMLSLPVLAPYRDSAASPQLQREKTLAILLDRLHAMAAQQPILLVVEDLHWADPSTLELLKLFVAQERTAPMLAVLTSRPDFQPPWQESLVRTLPLKTLADAEMAMLIAAVAPEIAPATVRRIVERADGIALFAEELAREVAANDRAIPSTLQDLLATRLDAMGAAKIVAQSAASIGREFSVDLLGRIVHCDEPALAQQLRQLQDAGIVRSETAGVLHFRHALVRDAAYQSQTRTERESTHRRIAAALGAAETRARPELLAQHWAAGAEVHEAVACWIEAGKLASQHSASQEAVVHFKSGLALMAALPENPERVRLELDLQIGLGAAASAAEGYASATGAEAYARATTLCSQHESGPEMFRAVWGLWTSASSRTGYAHALKLAQQLLRMAGKSGDPVQDQQGHFAVADTLYWQGEFASARQHLERAGMRYLPVHHKSHVAEFGEDAGITGGSYLSWVLWFLGFPDQARKTSEQTLALARQLEHPFSLAYALTFASILHCRLRRPEEALVLAKETLSLANDHGFPLWQIGATLSHGWALAMQNRPEGVESLQQCVEATRAAMGGVTLVVLEPLVDACVVLGLFDDALRVGSEAFAAASAVGDRHVEAELHRLKGESLLGLSGSCKTKAEAEAEACFHQALAVSRKQETRSLELRAAMSMARLWQGQGKPDDARRLLEGVYDWFTEGFDTPDLLDARELLDSLG